ncbi:MAG: hypothetical protein ABI193_20350 [Minicystis sp.]
MAPRDVHMDPVTVTVAFGVLKKVFDVGMSAALVNHLPAINLGPPS